MSTRWVTDEQWDYDIDYARDFTLIDSINLSKNFNLTHFYANFNIFSQDANNDWSR